jgi:hypothetical protein
VVDRPRRARAALAGADGRVLAASSRGPLPHTPRCQPSRAQDRIVSRPAGPGSLHRAIVTAARAPSINRVRERTRLGRGALIPPYRATRRARCSPPARRLRGSHRRGRRRSSRAARLAACSVCGSSSRRRSCGGGVEARQALFSRSGRLTRARPLQAGSRHLWQNRPARHRLRAITSSYGIPPAADATCRMPGSRGAVRGAGRRVVRRRAQEGKHAPRSRGRPLDEKP